MAETKNLMAEKVMHILHQNQDEKMVGYKTELQKVEVNPPETGEWGGTEAKPWPFKPKAGSLFPKKRTSVKMMIFQCITRKFSSVFRRRPPPPPASAGNFQLDIKAEICFEKVDHKKIKKIQPYHG